MAWFCCWQNHRNIAVSDFLKMTFKTWVCWVIWRKPDTAWSGWQVSASEIQYLSGSNAKGTLTIPPSVKTRFIDDEGYFLFLQIQERIQPVPVYHPTPGESRLAYQLTEEEQVRIAQRIGLIQHLPKGIFDPGSDPSDKKVKEWVLNRQNSLQYLFLSSSPIYFF